MTEDNNYYPPLFARFELRTISPHFGHTICGIYDNIEDAREEFLKTKRIPKAILKGLHDAKRLVYHACAADEFKGTIYIHQLNEDWGNLKEWCEALREKEGIDITYQGEGLPSLTRKVMLALLRRKVQRRATTIEERQELHKKQKGKCEMCGAARANACWLWLARGRERVGDLRGPQCAIAAGDSFRFRGR